MKAAVPSTAGGRRKQQGRCTDGLLGTGGEGEWRRGRDASAHTATAADDWKLQGE